MSYSTILVTEHGPACTITLNRPDSRNALTPTMLEELSAALNLANASSCRVVVLRGAGSSFCAGLDLSVLQNMRNNTEEMHRNEAIRIATLFRTLYASPKPTIAVVNGPAIAGGAGLATLCDFTLALPTAKFAYTEVRIGFIPALVSVFLALQIGEKQRRDLLLSGRVFDAAEACRLGLVTEVVEPGRLELRLQELVATLAANSPQSLAATKQLLLAQQAPWLDPALEHALSANTASRATSDFQEGISAFLEKRKPAWQRATEKDPTP